MQSLWLQEGMASVIDVNEQVLNNAQKLAQLEQYPISSWSYPRVMLGIPIERAISYADEVFFNFMSIAQYGPVMLKLPCMPIELYRNFAARELLRSDCTHLLMLDVDHKHPDTIIQMLARWVLLFPEVRIVSALAFMRQEPYKPVMGQIKQEHRHPTYINWRRGLMKIEHPSTAAILIHRSVFEEIEPPWFERMYGQVMQNIWPGEDTGFFQKCNDAHIDMYVDTTTETPHCRAELTTEKTYRDYLAAHPEMIRGLNA